MSRMNIHNGYRLAEGTDIFDFLDRFKDAMNPVRDRLDAALIAERASALIDTADLSGEPRPRNPIGAAWMAFHKEQITMKDTRGWDYNPHSVSVSIGRDPGTGRLLALLYDGNNREYVKAFKRLPGVEEYCYGGEKPRSVTRSAWEERRAAWARLVPTGVPGRHTYGFDLRGETDHPHELLSTPAGRRRILRLVPKKADRAARISRDAVFSGLDVKIENGSFAPIMTALRRIRGADIAAVTDIVEARLSDITLADLTSDGGDTVPGHESYAEGLAVAVTAAIALNRLDQPEDLDR
jgi:hypothetical protein